MTLSRNQIDIILLALDNSVKYADSEYIEAVNIIIEELSKRLNIPIDYYEDIYTNYTLNDKSIKLDKSFLDPSRKCRVNKIYAI